MKYQRHSPNSYNMHNSIQDNIYSNNISSWGSHNPDPKLKSSRNCLMKLPNFGLLNRSRTYLGMRLIDLIKYNSLNKPFSIQQLILSRDKNVVEWTLTWETFWKSSSVDFPIVQPSRGNSFIRSARKPVNFVKLDLFSFDFIDLNPQNFCKLHQELTAMIVSLPSIIERQDLFNRQIEFRDGFLFPDFAVLIA